MLRTDVLGEDPASPTLQALAKRVIDLVIESHARKQVQVGYVGAAARFLALLSGAARIAESSARADPACSRLKQARLADRHCRLDPARPN